MGAEITFKRPDGGDAKGYLTNAARGERLGSSSSRNGGAG